MDKSLLAENVAYWEHKFLLIIGEEVYIGSGVGIGCSAPLTNTFLLNAEMLYIRRGYKFS